MGRIIETRVMGNTVLIFTTAETITIDPSRSHGYLVAVNDREARKTKRIK